MLDVARNFQSKQQVLKLINLMAVYKLNTLHMHLTDDEGWRIEIPSLPELTAVGSKRGHTLDSKTHSCRRRMVPGPILTIKRVPVFIQRPII
jgi:hexosaminidase